MPSVTVGVCAHNEERSILRSLASISSQSPDSFDIAEILVVSSGSTDRTDDIVRGYSSNDPRVRLIVQERREGKYSAVNVIISEAEGEIVVLVNADNALAPGALSQLLMPLKEAGIGMVGGHPVPVNAPDSVVGFAVRMLWEMHHRLSLIVPKTGELVAFRNLHFQLPKGTNTDEDWIRMEMERKGYSIAYAPDAVVWNKGPETIQDFWKQRTRVNIGERYMKKRFGFTVPTWNASFLFQALLSFMRDNRGNVGKIMA
ncbi:MAG: glycosyltransferase, partial [Euryarchaeota archaeon]|nr:glycosyltransferase [Euryarchaeota archaeon]